MKLEKYSTVVGRLMHTPLKKQELANAKRDKLNLKLAFSEINSKDLSHSDEMDILSDQLDVFNKIIRDAQHEITLKEKTLKNMQEKNDVHPMDKSGTTEKISELNRGNLLKELQAQSKKINMQKNLRNRKGKKLLMQKKKK